jgi:hypothetical protein
MAPNRAEGKADLSGAERKGRPLSGALNRITVAVAFTRY